MRRRSIWQNATPVLFKAKQDWSWRDRLGLMKHLQTAIPLSGGLTDNTAASGSGTGCGLSALLGDPGPKSPLRARRQDQRKPSGFYDSGLFSIHICSNRSLVENCYIQKNQVSENVPASCCFQLWMPRHDFLTQNLLRLLGGETCWEERPNHLYTQVTWSLVWKTQWNLQEVARTNERGARKPTVPATFNQGLEIQKQY